MLTSDRRFGVEIEFICDNANSLRSIRDRINVVRDGSLDPHPYAGEFVSTPISGSHGEQTIYDVCGVLKRYGASPEDPKTSVHIHLDGKNTGGQLRASPTKPDFRFPKLVIGVSNKLRREIGMTTITDILLRNRSDNLVGVHTTYIDNITYLSKAPISRAPRLNYTYYYMEKPDRFEWLQKVFYFYTKYSEVMESIVSNSRKFGNMYCIPLGKSYDLEDIAKASSMEELKSVWYKGRQPNGHYDNSRYHNVNLHSFWDRHGTVEIRSHGGTVDPNKILLWVKLHQKIVDKLEDFEMTDLIELSPAPKAFAEFVEEPLLIEYIKRLLGYFSGIKIE